MKLNSEVRVKTKQKVAFHRIKFLNLLHIPTELYSPKEVSIIPLRIPLVVSMSTKIWILKIV
jgi:hypothetical protein